MKYQTSQTSGPKSHQVNPIGKLKPHSVLKQLLQRGHSTLLFHLILIRQVIYHPRSYIIHLKPTPQCRRSILHYSSKTPLSLNDTFQVDINNSRLEGLLHVRQVPNFAYYLLDNHRQS